MCFSPIRIINKSDRIAADGGKPILYVPCGHCDECLESKKKQYYVRTFAEYQDIQPFVEIGQGMVYFDTFTYNNKNLPLWHGIKVFNHEHIKLTLKRLRRSLSYDGYPVDGNLRYFICSEYGDDTQRPHYHVLFFVRFKIDPEKFWDYLNKAWIYGFIDRKYQKVVRGKLCKGAKERVIDGNGALRYVSGYVVKDKNFMKIFHQKVDELLSTGYEIDDNIIRSLEPRFFLSRGYGLSFLEDQSAKFHFDKEYYEKTGKITISDFKHIKQDFALPEYYRRKLYFDVKKEKLPGRGFDQKSGKEIDLFRIRWIPNKNYVDYLLNHYQDLIHGTASTLHNVYFNLSSQYDPFLGKSIRDYVSGLLGNRTFEDLALYSLFYRYRIGFSGLRSFDIGDFVSRSLSDNTVSIDHSSKYNEYDSIDQLSPYIITDRCSSEFENFDEILTILDGHNIKARKDVFALVKYIRVQKKKSKYRSKNYY